MTTNKIFFPLVLMLLAAVAGCNGVSLNAEYSQLLDRNLALSKAMVGIIGEEIDTEKVRLSESIDQIIDEGIRKTKSTAEIRESLVVLFQNTARRKDLRDLVLLQVRMWQAFQYGRDGLPKSVKDELTKAEGGSNGPVGIEK